MMGRGDRREADRVATEAMRTAMEEVEIQGTVVIGEGQRHDALAAGQVDIGLPPAENFARIAGGVGSKVRNVTVIILRRRCLLGDRAPGVGRTRGLFKLIGDGDLSAPPGRHPRRGTPRRGRPRRRRELTRRHRAASAPGRPRARPAARHTGPTKVRRPGHQTRCA